MIEENENKVVKYYQGKSITSKGTPPRFYIEGIDRDFASPDEAISFMNILNNVEKFMEEVRKKEIEEQEGKFQPLKTSP